MEYKTKFFAFLSLVVWFWERCGQALKIGGGNDLLGHLLTLYNGACTTYFQEFLSNVVWNYVCFLPPETQFGLSSF